MSQQAKTLQAQSQCFVHYPICASDGCGQPAVVWVGGIARDKGTPLCDDCADEIRAYIARKVASLESPPSPGSRGTGMSNEG